MYLKSRRQFANWNAAFRPWSARSSVRVRGQRQTTNSSFSRKSITTDARLRIERDMGGSGCDSNVLMGDRLWFDQAVDSSYDINLKVRRYRRPQAGNEVD